MKWPDLHAMTEEKAYEVYVAARFAVNGGEPFCPHCPAPKLGEPYAPVYKLRTRRVFTCSLCSRQFSATTGTPFQDRKLSYKKILLALAEFSTPTTGINANTLSRKIGVKYRTGYLTGDKCRKWMMNCAQDQDFRGTFVEVDGCYIGGFQRTTNSRKTAEGRRLPYKFGADPEKRQCVVIIRERGGDRRISTAVFKEEADAKQWVSRMLPRYTDITVATDFAGWWLRLNIGRRHLRVNHDENYWTSEVDTNTAESFFGILRRTAKGIYHRISGKKLNHYASELAWRQEHNKLSDGERYQRLLLGMAAHVRA